VETIDWWELPEEKRRGDNGLVGFAAQEKTPMGMIDWWELLQREKGGGNNGWVDNNLVPRLR
jgi:hypothetical protein